MTWSFTPWKIYFTNRQQIIYLYFSVKFFFKFPLQSFGDIYTGEIPKRNEKMRGFNYM